MPADYFPNYHATLLARAAPRGFSKTTLLFQIIPANITVDLNQKDHWLHFDNSSFLAALQHVEALSAQIQAGSACMANFGRLTHTVQDFYSHSNWVELHQHESPLPVWDMNIATLPPWAHSGTSQVAPAAPGQTAPTHAELNKDSPFRWFSPSGCPGRGRRPQPWQDPLPARL